ncbi:MAG: flavin reductase family protein [Thermoproteota archaeon]
MKTINLNEWVYILHPRPAVAIVSGSWNDYSAMTASWTMPVSRKPPIVAVAVSKKRYTYEKIVESREFAVCVLGLEKLRELHKLGSISGRDVKDKIVSCGLSKIKGRKIKCPIIEESIAVTECKLSNIVESGDHDIILGEILEAYLLKDVELDTEKYNIPLHVFRSKYCKFSEFIEL